MYICHLDQQEKRWPGTGWKKDIMSNFKLSYKLKHPMHPAVNNVLTKKTPPSYDKARYNDFKRSFKAGAVWLRCRSSSIKFPFKLICDKTKGATFGQIQIEDAFQQGRFLKETGFRAYDCKKKTYPCEANYPFHYNPNVDRFDCTGKYCKTICIPGYGPLDKRLLKCGNDHKWYQEYDSKHQNPFTLSGSSIPKSHECTSCSIHWQKIESEFETAAGKYKDNMVQVDGADYNLTFTNPYIQRVGFKCPGMNGGGGDVTWKEKLQFNDRKFKAKKSGQEVGQKRLSCICKRPVWGFGPNSKHIQYCHWYQGSKKLKDATSTPPSTELEDFLKNIKCTVKGGYAARGIMPP